MYVYKINRESKAIAYIKENGCVFISRYKSSHSSARKVLRKMLKESKVVMYMECRDGFMYKLKHATVGDK